MAPRGRGGKFSKPTRGGGKHFSRNLQPLDKDGNPLGMWRDPNDIVAESEEEDSEEDSEEESEEESEGESGPTHSASGKEMTREERKAAAKARKEAAIAKKNKVTPGDLPPSDDEDDDDEDMPANPNHTAKSRSQAAKGPAEANGEAVPAAAKSSDMSQLSRREKEAIQAQQARERYMKLHAEGKTEEARADLARLALVKERREAEKARKEAEREEREEREREKAEAKAREAKLREAALGPAAKGKKMTPKKK
ncbi:hypothetical protein AJ78_05958 [Emergomyces pasteurianus Ep9510]|uniref:Casein kinase substrate phosphoprotein PP28 domain-containing protein n=1 Tax=Emergomyces pasteurianus Ep9510 TaxID=1447872 RepID=A0A1J9QEI2_9EURO|nr:hypothetical protein AJ78_05958 [Emergomyces pasteurianus Ep9510]